MRAREFFGEAERSPIINLRHINKLKKVKLARQTKSARRQALISVMYANPAGELEQIELEKARAELAQEKAELAATKAEGERANKEALASMAASGMEARRDNHEKINKMARRELVRRKKL